MFLMLKCIWTEDFLLQIALLCNPWCISADQTLKLVYGFSLETRPYWHLLFPSSNLNPNIFASDDAPVSSWREQPLFSHSLKTNPIKQTNVCILGDFYQMSRITEAWCVVFQISLFTKLDLDSHMKNKQIVEWFCYLCQMPCNDLKVSMKRWLLEHCGEELLWTSYPVIYYQIIIQVSSEQLPVCAGSSEEDYHVSSHPSLS